MSSRTFAMFSTMKFALISLLSVVVFSNQQFHEQSTDEKLLWLLSYYSPQLPVSKYNYQPVNHHNSDDGNYHLRPSSSGSSMNSQSINDYLSSNYNNDELEMPFFRQLQRTDPGRKEADTKLRNKELNRYQPLPPNNARFVLNFSSRTHLLDKVNTITFTITSSVTFTKRAEIVESITNWKYIQLAIKPTYVQPVEPTVISALNLLTGNAELPLISSSKDEDLLNEKQNSQEMPLSKQSRMKRLFFHLVTTTTVVSYTFFSATITKTVNLLSVVEQGPGYLICRLEGFLVCSSSSTINT
nr:putative cladoceran-specific protein type 1 [Daphnia magna]